MIKCSLPLSLSPSLCLSVALFHSLFLSRSSLCVSLYQHSFIYIYTHHSLTHSFFHSLSVSHSLSLSLSLSHSLSLSLSSSLSFFLSLSLSLSSHSLSPTFYLSISLFRSVVENHQMISPASWSPSLIQESKSKLKALTASDDTRKAK